MTDEAKTFFVRTRIASPCRCVVPDPGHPLFGHDDDKGPENAVDVFLSLGPAARREVATALPTIFGALQARGFDLNALIKEPQS